MVDSKKLLVVLLVVFHVFILLLLSLFVRGQYLKEDSKIKLKTYSSLSHAINRSVLMDCKACSSKRTWDAFKDSGAKYYDPSQRCPCIFKNDEIYTDMVIGRNGSTLVGGKDLYTANIHRVRSAVGACRVAWVLARWEPQWAKKLSSLTCYFIPPFVIEMLVGGWFEHTLRISSQVLSDKEMRKKIKDALIDPCKYLYNTDENDYFLKNRTADINDIYDRDGWSALSCGEGCKYDDASIDIEIVEMTGFDANKRPVFKVKSKLSVREFLAGN